MKAALTDTPKEPSSPVRRRTVLKTLLGAGLATGLDGCAPGASAPPAVAPTDAPAPEDRPSTEPASGAAADVPHEHPADGDRLVFAFGDREGQVIGVDDIQLGEEQVFAYPMDATSAHIASESRLDQVILVRLDPAQLSAETAANSVDGIVAYSAVCTHTGCEVSDWDGQARRFQCPCHESEFDPGDNGRVLGGPAPRRLAALPLRSSDGMLIVAGGFTGRVGAQRR